MFGKLVLTAAIILLAFYAIRDRARPGPDDPAGGPATGAPARPTGPLTRSNLIRAAAASVVLIMLLGSALTLWQGWTRARDVITVQVANPITGTAERFEARRTDIGERTIRTLDGRLIRVSEVERIIIED